MVNQQAQVLLVIRLMEQERLHLLMPLQELIQTVFISTSWTQGLTGSGGCKWTPEKQNLFHLHPSSIKMNKGLNYLMFMKVYTEKETFIDFRLFSGLKGY